MSLSVRDLMRAGFNKYQAKLIAADDAAEGVIAPGASELEVYLGTPQEVGFGTVGETITSLATVEFLSADATIAGTDLTFNDATHAVVVGTTGLYRLSANIDWDTNATGYRAGKFLFSPAPYSYQKERGYLSVPALGLDDDTLTLAPQTLVLPAGATIKIEVGQNSGVALNVVYAELGVRRLL